MTRVLVTAARGLAGAPLIELLTRRPGVEVVGGSSSSSVTLPAGARSTTLSWEDPSGWSAALEGVDAVYLVRPDRADAPELVAEFLDLVSTTAHVTLVSQRAADYPDLDHWAQRVEGAVLASGRRWTVLRPSWFMQVLTDRRFFRDEIVEDATLSFAAGGSTVAWIDTRDIAAVAARSLLDDDLAGSVFEVTGPESLSLPNTAEALSVALGRRVVHRDVSVEEAVAASEGFLADLASVTFRRVRAGAFAEVTDVVERVTGARARSLETFLVDHKHLLCAAVPPAADTAG